MNERLRGIRRVTITTTRRRTLRIQSVEFRTSCPICESVVGTPTPGEVATFLEADTRAVEDPIRGALIQILQTVSGSRRLCPDCLVIRESAEKV